MTDEFFDRIVAAIRVQMLAAGQNPDLLDVADERRKLRLPLANGARFSMTREALSDLGHETWQIAEAFYERYRMKATA